MFTRLLSRGQNNLGFVRFVAALLVILSHAYPLTLGPSANNTYEPIYRLTGQQTGGGLAVAIFFLVSGFLVTASWERSRSPVAFLRARLLRIYPGLITVVVVTVVVLGPLMSTYPPDSYFSSRATYAYLLTALTADSGYRLPGLFESLPYHHTNGSLWTLTWELLCYAGLLVLGVLRLLRFRLALLIVVLLHLALHYVGVTEYVLFRYGLDWPVEPLNAFFSVRTYRNLAYFPTTFLAGALFYLYRDKIRLTRQGALLATLALLLSVTLGKYFFYALPTAGAYILFYLSALPSRLNTFGSKSDYSYGLYIYAWPIQQTLCVLFGGVITPLLNFGLAIPLVLAAAFLSWHLVERPALRLGEIRRVRTSPRPSLEVRAS